ncbi:MAG: hypothetical protein KR126chlam3_00453 [Chlamydiae bacterium]|nr:hypothetical protein [Chlamydiota bacterium]
MFAGLCSSVFSESSCDQLSEFIRENERLLNSLGVVVGTLIANAITSRYNLGKTQKTWALGQEIEILYRLHRQIQNPLPLKSFLLELLEKHCASPNVSELITTAISSESLEGLSSFNPRLEELAVLMKGMLSNPPREEEIRRAERLYVILLIQGISSFQFNRVKERWGQLGEAAKLYENWSSKTPEDQKRVFVEVFEKHCQDKPKNSDHLQITDPRNEIIGEMRHSSFAWVFKRSKEVLKQTLIDGIPILHWAIINRNYGLLVKLISRGFTVEDIRGLEGNFLHYQIQEIETGKPSFPLPKMDKDTLDQMKFFLENPPEEAALKDAKRMASIFGVEFLKVLPNFIALDKSRDKAPVPGGELEEEQEEEQTYGVPAEKPTYTITDPRGETSKIGKFPKRTEIQRGEEERLISVSCEWDSAFDWVLDKSKEELQQTMIDGIPLLPWAVFHKEETLIAKLIHRGFSLEDLEIVKGNLLRYRVQNFESEYLSQISLLGEPEQRRLELAKELISKPPEKEEMKLVSKTTAMIYAITLQGFAEAPLRHCERNWEQLTETARFCVPFAN